MSAGGFAGPMRSTLHRRLCAKEGGQQLQRALADVVESGTVRFNALGVELGHAGRSEEAGSEGGTSRDGAQEEFAAWTASAAISAALATATAQQPQQQLSSSS